MNGFQATTVACHPARPPSVATRLATRPGGQDRGPAGRPEPADYAAERQAVASPTYP
jgi:hypothetical protein